MTKSNVRFQLSWDDFLIGKTTFSLRNGINYDEKVLKEKMYKIINVEIYMPPTS